MFKNSILGKILKAIFKILLWILEIVIIFIAIIIVTQRVTNDQKTFLGFRIYNVATGSMEPEYAVGDILISIEKDPSEIKVGDNIVYLGDEGGYDGKIITHNVIAIEQNEKGEYLFHTMGRANTVEDPIVSEDQLYGVVVQNNIVLAWLCKILTNRYGLYFFVMVPVILYAFIAFIKAQSEKIEQEKQEEFERRKRQEAKRRKRKQMEMQRRQVIEIEEEQDEEIIEEEVVAEKPKTQKKSTTTRKKKVEEAPLEEVKEKTKKTSKNEEVKEKTKNTSKSKENNTDSEKKKTQGRKKAKEE